MRRGSGGSRTLRAPRDRQQGPSRGAGWEYVHVCVDDHSRLACMEVLDDEKAATATGFLRRAVTFYRSRGSRCGR